MLWWIPLISVLLPGALCGILDSMALDQGMSHQEKQYILNYHNEIRAIVAKGKGIGGQPPGKNMAPLLWNEDLARNAQTWADNCDGPSHDDSTVRGQGTGFNYVGQNLMDCGIDSECIATAMKAFYAEAASYAFDGQVCSITNCGHYRQLAWAKTRYVGCGYNRCRGHVRTDGKRTAARLVCDYGPGGHINGQDPYERGDACTGCPSGRAFCLQDLCWNRTECHSAAESNGGANCECKVVGSLCAANGGTYDAANCYCKCDSSKAGMNCQVPCDNKLATCPQYAGAGFCAKTSPYYAWMEMNCPNSCGFCGSPPPMPSNPNFIANAGRPADQRPAPVQPKMCVEGNGVTFAGAVSQTSSGHTCQRWDAQSPHTHTYLDGSAFADGDVTAAGNHCRNPAGGSSAPWCYTTVASPRWGYCSAPAC